ncbi:lysM domain-containing GPI-anchored protein 2 [Quercus suber]|uniref:lysM domain-containing GPI-anchored protein 2 n=1 Tax=Quercus suber TaxID=58331 RepID=UPI0032DFD534
MGYAKVLVGVLLFITLATTSTAQPPPNFTCSATTKSTCHSLVDYVSPNTTVLSTIQSLFQIMRFHDLFGANGFPTSTSPNETLQAQQRIKIPFNCRCENGTGVSDRAPVYTVIKDDGLYHIAAEIFSNLVTYQEIAKVNGITDPNNITIGQELWIPLPCSCDEVEGVKVVHYGHVVESGSSVDKIAMEYGTTPAILLKLNGITNASELQANQVLDVPQRFLPFTSRHSLC